MIKVSIYLPFDHYYRNKKQLLLLMGPQVQCTWSSGTVYVVGWGSVFSFGGSPRGFRPLQRRRAVLEARLKRGPAVSPRTGRQKTLSQRSSSRNGNLCPGRERQHPVPWGSSLGHGELRPRRSSQEPWNGAQLRGPPPQKGSLRAMPPSCQVARFHVQNSRSE